MQINLRKPLVLVLMPPVKVGWSQSMNAAAGSTVTSGGGYCKQRKHALVLLVLWLLLWGQLQAALKQEPIVSQEYWVPCAQNYAIVLASSFYFHSFNCFSQLFVL